MCANSLGCKGHRCAAPYFLMRSAHTCLRHRREGAPDVAHVHTGKPMKRYINISVIIQSGCIRQAFHANFFFFFSFFNQRIYYFNLDLIFKTTPGLNGKPTNQICISVYELRCVHFRHSRSVQKFKHLANSNVNY